MLTAQMSMAHSPIQERIAGFLLHLQALLLLPHTMGAHGSLKAEARAQRRPLHELQVLWRIKDLI